MQYYVVKEDVDVLAAKLGTTAEALSKKGISYSDNTP